jgi:hypothetical protein
MAGVNGDNPGIVMKTHPAIGDFYREEFSLANAEDFAETLSLTESVTVPAGTFHHGLKSQETTPLETDLLEYKFYAPGVGNVLEVDANTGDAWNWWRSGVIEPQLVRCIFLRAGFGIE